MVAVFTRFEAVYKDFMFNYPKPEDFMRIRHIDDVLRCRFTRVMKLGDWYANQEIRDAHNLLKSKRPELFK